MSSWKDLQALYGSGGGASSGPKPVSDYADAPARKSKKAKVKAVSGFKLMDYDSLNKVASAAKRDEEEDEEEEGALSTARRESSSCPHSAPLPSPSFPAALTVDITIM